MTSPGLPSLVFFQTFLLGLCFLAGYLSASWWQNTLDAAPLARICAQVHYLDSLQESESKEVSYEFRSLVAECRKALGDSAED
jgi:hypothetical protein